MPRDLQQIIDQVDGIRAELVALRGGDQAVGADMRKANALVEALKNDFDNSGLKSSRVSLWMSPEGKPFIRVAISPKASGVKYTSPENKHDVVQDIIGEVYDFIADQTTKARCFFSDKAHPGFEYNRYLYIHIGDEVK
mgnify:CR=1 FL=1